MAGAVAELIQVEPRFGPIVERYGVPGLRLVDNSLPSLLRIVTEQLISLKAAEAIWNRLAAHLGCMSPDAILSSGVQGVKAQGTTTAKARCFVALAEAVRSGALDFQALEALPDHEARHKLLAIPGIGPWTAEIYLLTALGRADACPAGDVALQAALHHLFELEGRPGTRDFLAQAEAWRPWRAVAARLLWSHYRGLKGWPQA